MLENSLFLIASFIAAVIATLAGFGSSTLLVPVAALFMDLKTAVFLVACFHLFNNLFKIKLFWHSINFKTFAFFGIPGILFAFIGALSISIMPTGTVKKILATFLIGFSIYSLINPGFSVKETKATALIGGGLSGFLAGLIGLGGAIRSTCLVAFHLPKAMYVATSAAIAFVIDLTRIPTYLFSKVVQDASYYALLPFLFVSAYLGVKVGKVFLDKVSQEIFRRIVLVALLLVGVKLLF